MTQNIELMRAAKAQLRGKWGMAAVATLLFMIVCAGVGSIVPLVGSLIIGGPMLLGYVLYLMAVHRGGEGDFETLFSGFKDFVRTLVAYLVMSVLIMVGMILLIVPGIIVSLGLSMTFYILAEDKEIEPLDALRKSWDMMMGHKWKYFCLMFRFFGWWLLCMITFGILLFWVTPYMQLAGMNFYDDIKGGYLKKN